MAIIERTYAPQKGAAVDEVLMTADSHVIEPTGLWHSRRRWHWPASTACGRAD